MCQGGCVGRDVSGGMRREGCVGGDVSGGGGGDVIERKRETRSDEHIHIVIL